MAWSLRRIFECISVQRLKFGLNSFELRLNSVELKLNSVKLNHNSVELH